VKPRFFATPAAFRAWLEIHHEKKTELLVGFHKRATGKQCITWPESVDCALSFGWIDGVRKRIDDDRYVIRFTPRKATSIWSAINIARVKVLTDEGLMRPAGLAAFAARRKDKSAIYSYEQRKSATLGDYEAKLRANPKAWTFFQAQAPWYRRTASHWVVSAKKEETREKRLAILIEDSANGRPIPPLRYR
jgi:uncharacterized protein YdeI (YjbR/CyaY-like superfamily)